MRKPTLTGPGGRAWELSKNMKRDPAHEASLAGWLVNAPGCHPFWSWWYVGVVHLRDLPGVPPAKKHYAEAEYEFTIFAINPELCPEPNPDSTEGFPMLVPLDVAEQFHGVTDQDASRICMAAVRAIMAGQMSPDQDYRSVWRARLAETVRHFQIGAHLQH